MIKTFYSDLDDFAFLTTPHYERAKALAIFIMVKEFGQNFPALEKVVEELGHHDNQSHKIGYHILERFPESLVNAYRRVAELIGVEPRKGIEKDIYEIGMAPFNIKIYKGQDLMPGYQRLMDYLKEHNVKLGVITKGQKKYQLEKVDYFNLWRWFERENIHVFEQKNKHDLAQLIQNTESTMFGTDSSDDVNAALEVGIKVLHVPLSYIYTTTFNNPPLQTSKNYNKVDSLTQFDIITTILE